MKPITVLNDIQLSKNFRLSEFVCHDGTETVLIAPGLVDRLQMLRSLAGKPVRIQSAYRSPEHNALIGGVENSRHILGEAADIKVDGFSPLEVAHIAKYVGFTGIGIYIYNGQSFVHVDVRPSKSYWCDNIGTKTLTPIKKLPPLAKPLPFLA